MWIGDPTKGNPAHLSVENESELNEFINRIDPFENKQLEIIFDNQKIFVKRYVLYKIR